MHSSTILFVAVFAVGFVHLLQASPIGHVGFLSVEDNHETTTTALEASTTPEAPILLSNETAVIDTLTEGSNETHIRQKRSCGCCGCCCCRPCCCCCCRPCCCCCRCCCCRCCCCCCRPCCCCCCRPCCCCGGCCGGRKRRSIQALSHKLMDKQAALLREAPIAPESFSTTSTEAPITAIYTNAQIDAFGRSYANLAFADFTNDATPVRYFYGPQQQ